MKKYIAELTESGLYNLVVVKEELSNTCYMLDGQKVFDRLIVDDNGEQRIFSPRTMTYKEFDDLEECSNYIGYMNRY